MTGWFTLHSTERPAYRAHKGVQILFSARTVQHPGELSEKRRGRLPLRPNDFHACSFMRRKSILEEDAFFFLLLLLVVLRVCMMKREQKQQIIFPTCGFAAKASGKLFHPCLAALADHILQPCRRSETRGSRRHHVPFASHRNARFRPSRRERAGRGRLGQFSG